MFQNMFNNRALELHGRYMPQRANVASAKKEQGPTIHVFTLGEDIVSIAGSHVDTLEIRGGTVAVLDSAKIFSVENLDNKTGIYFYTSRNNTAANFYVSRFNFDDETGEYHGSERLGAVTFDLVSGKMPRKLKIGEKVWDIDELPIHQL